MIEVARNQTAAIARLDLRAVLTVRLSGKIRHEQLDQNVLRTGIAIGCEIDTQHNAPCTGDHPA